MLMLTLASLFTSTWHIVSLVLGFVLWRLVVSHFKRKNTHLSRSRSLQEQIESRKMTIKGQVVVYSIIGCQHCMKAKNTLQNMGIPYTDITLDAFPQCREYVKQRTGKQTVPQIFFNNIFVGGNEELQKMIADETAWEKLIEEIKNNEASADAPQIPDPSTAVNTEIFGDFVCEPDEYALLVRELKASGIIKDHRKGLTTHRHSFTGKEFVEWVVKNKQLDRSEAIVMGQSLVDQHFGGDVKKQQVTFQDDSSIYRLLEDDTSTALNGGETSECEPRPASVVGEDIRKLILKIYSAFLTDGGKKVNYTGIAGSAEFIKYKRLTQELVRVHVESATREEKIAFFINIYNALVVHANIVKGPPGNLWQRYKFFNTVRYWIGGHIYSLQDIENGVLRGNRKGVGMMSKPFGKNDQRLKVALSKAEPLIHFALVCGAKSCPPIKTYSAEGIDEQLKMAAEAFLEGDDSIEINMTKKEIKLSMIFKWYREDFGKNNDEVLQFLHDHMADGEKKTHLAELLGGKKYKVNHLTYDWSINS